MSQSCCSDKELFLAIARGDRSAYSTFIERHARAIVAFAYRQVDNSADAEDIAQEVFIRVWRHAADWHDQGVSPRSWLYRICYNQCIDLLRQQQRYTDNKILTPEASPQDLEQDLLTATNRSNCYRAITTLPLRQRSALLLCAWHGLSNIEAANSMGISVEALESLLARARRKLKVIIQSANSQTDHHELQTQQTAYSGQSRKDIA